MSPATFYGAITGCFAAGFLAIRVFLRMPILIGQHGLGIALGMLVAVAGMLLGGIVGWLIDTARCERRHKRPPAHVPAQPLPSWHLVERSLEQRRRSS